MPAASSLVLLAIASAHAGPEAKVQRALEKGDPQKAWELCEKDLQKSAVLTAEHCEACARAGLSYYPQVHRGADLERYLRSVYTEWPDTEAGLQAWEASATLGFELAGKDRIARAAAAMRYEGTAFVRAAEQLEWEALQGDPDSEAAQAFAQVWPRSQHRDEALALAARLDFEAAQSSEALLGFVERWPDSELVAEARDKARGLDLQAADTPEALLAFLQRWPEAEEASEVALRLTQASLVMEPSCEEGCPSLTELSVTWTHQAAAPVSIELMGRKGEEPVLLEAAFEAWAGALSEQVPRALEGLEIQQGEGSWSLKAPFLLKRAGGIDGYQLLVQVGEGSFVVPIQVTEAYPEIEALTGFLYTDGDALRHQARLGAPSRDIASFRGSRLSYQSEVVDGALLVWGPGGLERVDLASGARTRLAPGPLDRGDENETCWFFEGRWLYFPATGELRKLAIPLGTSNRRGDLAVDDSCERLAVLNEANQQLQVFSLQTSKLLHTHRIEAMKQRSYPGGSAPPVSPRWVGSKLFVELFGYHSLEATVEIDLRAGTERRVREQPRPPEPKQGLPPAGSDVTLLVERAGPAPEVFVDDGQGGRTQLTKIHALPVEDGFDCTALSPAQRKVQARLTPGLPLAYIHATTARCVDPYDGSSMEQGTAFLATLDGSRQLELSSSWPPPFQRWSWSPDHSFLVIEHRIIDADLNVVELPADAKLIHWFQAELSDWLR